MVTTTKRLNRVLTNLHHGGHTVSTTGKAPEAVPAENALFEMVVQEAAPSCLDDETTPFDYLFGALRDTYPAGHLPVEPPSTVVAALKVLGAAMVDQPPDAEPNSDIPPVYTYWGQFVDHDITANTDREAAVSILTDPLTPIEPGFVKSLVRNLREPALNLDSVYGNGPHQPDVPKEVPYDGIALRVGQLQADNVPPVPVGGGDVPRVRTGEEVTDFPVGRARIGDARNDENLIVAQLHRAFLAFHNKVLEWLTTNEPELTGDEERFARARQLTTWHYQAIVVEDFLRIVARSSVVTELLATSVADRVSRPLPGGGTEVFMPLEHSVAAFRFGHSMVRAEYDHNENFGRAVDDTEQLDPATGRPRRATFDQMFLFTGGGVIHVPPRAGQPFALRSFPSNWPIRWRRFTDGDQDDRFARKIDTHLAPPLLALSNEGNVKADGVTPETDPRIKGILKQLAVRNLLRGYRLGIPTGQAVAAALGVTPLTRAELLQGDLGVADALVEGHFLDATPLWFYVLKEAEVQEQGQRLGEVGSRIVATTLIGQLQADPTSYLSQQGGWSPAQGVKLPAGGEVNTIKTFLEFAEVLDPPA